MSTTTIALVALVSMTERAAVETACRIIASALSEASGQPWTCNCSFIDEPGDLQAQAAGAVLVTSLVSEVEGLVSWPNVEARLRGFYAGLCAPGDPVFICTVFRHVCSGDCELELQRRVRIRRLNLSAANISRESGAYVIDIDRRLSDIGAHRLGTDYRMHGAAAIDLAGNAIAREIILNGLDAVADVDLQNRALAVLSPYQPAIAATPPIEAAYLRPMGRGRRTQLAATLPNVNREGDVAWLIRQTLKRQIGAVYALDKVLQAIRLRGVRKTFALLASGAARLIVRRT
jgi:hypothetical protein